MLFNLEIHETFKKAVESWKKTHDGNINPEFLVYSTISYHKKWWKINNVEIPDFESRGYTYEGKVKDF